MTLYCFFGLRVGKLCTHMHSVAIMTNKCDVRDIVFLP